MKRGIGDLSRGTQKLASAVQQAVSDVRGQAAAGAETREVAPVGSAKVFAAYEAYIDSATGERGDTRTDRILALFRYVRSNVSEANWHRIEGLREFSRTYHAWNPFIPPDVRRSQIASESLRYDFQPFPEDWVKAGGKTQPLNIHADDVAAAIEVSEEIGQAFVENNLHSDDYFFTKFVEWFVTLLRVQETGARHLLDLGAAYPGFGRLATRLFPELEVTLVDIAFPPGRAQIGDRIFRMQGDAGDLSDIADGSVDLICSHNAFEHFAGQSDVRCVAEMQRILRPGGIGLITPFMSGRRHAVTLNPFACFVFGRDDGLIEAVRDEVRDLSCAVRFNHEIISPYARVYSAETAMQRLVTPNAGLEAVLRPVRLIEDGFAADGVYRSPILGKTLRRSILDKAHFQALELRRL